MGPCNFMTVAWRLQARSILAAHINISRRLAFFERGAYQPLPALGAGALCHLITWWARHLLLRWQLAPHQLGHSRWRYCVI